MQYIFFGRKSQFDWQSTKIAKLLEIWPKTSMIYVSIVNVSNPPLIDTIKRNTWTIKKNRPKICWNFCGRNYSVHMNYRFFNVNINLKYQISCPEHVWVIIQLSKQFASKILSKIVSSFFSTKTTQKLKSFCIIMTTSFFVMFLSKKY